MTEDAKDMIHALTSQFPNYSERLAESIDCPVTELWMIFLGLTGRMEFPHQSDERSTDVPDANLRDGRTRYEVWRSALVGTISILGDPEAGYRLGWNTSELKQAVDRYFS